MKDFLFSAKTSFIFIGTVIGAGFATGEEIQLYFQNYNTLTVVFSSLTFSLLFALFLCVGGIRTAYDSGKIAKVCNVVKCVVVLISVCAMGAGSEEVLYALFGIRGGGAITLVVCYLLTQKDKNCLSFVNFIAVPLIVVLIILIFIKADTGVVISTKFGLISSVGYACMNIFCASLTLKEKNLTLKRLVISTLITFLLLTTLMLCIKFSINNAVGSMPMIKVAEEIGLKKVAEVVVYLAIFTTMLGNLSVIKGEVKSLFKSDVLAVIFFCTIVLFGVIVGFSNVVGYGYPVISFFGVTYTVYCVILLVFRGKFLFNKGNDSVHSSCKCT